MGRPSLSMDIAKKDQQQLRSLLKGGVQQVRVVLRALALLQLAEDASAPQIAKVIPLTAALQSQRTGGVPGREADHAARRGSPGFLEVLHARKLAPAAEVHSNP